MTATAVLIALLVFALAEAHQSAYGRIGREVNSLLAAIPQSGSTLGRSTAPVTMQVYADLKDPDSRNWFLNYLPSIVHDDVRTGLLKIEYHSFKTNTYYPAEFVKEQTAALAAGAQHKLWNFVDVFYHEQGNEFARYATERYLDNIARQIPGLNLSWWHTARHTERREEQTTAEDQTAKTLGLHVTPSFLIARTGSPIKLFIGRHVLIHDGQKNPISLVDTEDLEIEIKKLT